MNDWLNVMLGEIDRRRDEDREAAEEAARRSRRAMQPKQKIASSPRLFFAAVLAALAPSGKIPQELVR